MLNKDYIDKDIKQTALVNAIIDRNEHLIDLLIEGNGRIDKDGVIAFMHAVEHKSLVPIREYLTKPPYFFYSKEGARFYLGREFTDEETHRMSYEELIAAGQSRAGIYSSLLMEVIISRINLEIAEIASQTNTVDTSEGLNKVLKLLKKNRSMKLNFTAIDSTKYNSTDK